MRAIQPDKIIVARESRGLTQAALAERLRISQAQLSKLEAGLVRGAPAMAEAIGRALDYPSEFFFLVDPVFGSGPNELYHRKRQSTSTKLLRQIYALVNIQRISITRLLRCLEIQANIPRLTVNEFNNPQGVARSLRAAWHVPPGPIADLTGLIEANGGLVIERDFGSPLLDGVSQWLPGLPPMFFMNAASCRSRRKLTLAHELAHIVMHAIPSAAMEEEANDFAGEFLMPEREIKAQLRALSLQRLAELKLHWKVSMAAILYRASQMGTVSRDDSAMLWRRLSHAGYRKNEPLELDLPEEKPALLRHLLDTHKKTLSYSQEDLMRLLVVNESDFRDAYGQETRFRVVAKRA